MNKEIVQAQRVVLAMAADYIGAAYQSKRASNLDESRTEKEVYECISGIQRWRLLTQPELDLASVDEFLQALIGNMNWDIAYCPDATYLYDKLLYDINRHFGCQFNLDQAEGERDRALVLSTRCLRAEFSKRFPRIADQALFNGLQAVVDAELVGKAPEEFKRIKEILCRNAEKIADAVQCSVTNNGAGELSEFEAIRGISSAQIHAYVPT